MKTPHPALTPKRTAELSELAKWIDKHEADELKAAGNAMFAEIDAKRKADGQANARVERQDETSK